VCRNCIKSLTTYEVNRSAVVTLSHIQFIYITLSYHHIISYYYYYYYYYCTLRRRRDEERLEALASKYHNLALIVGQQTSGAEQSLPHTAAHLLFLLFAINNIIAMLTAAVVIAIATVSPASQGLCGWQDHRQHHLLSLYLNNTSTHQHLLVPHLPLPLLGLVVVSWGGGSVEGVGEVEVRGVVMCDDALHTTQSTATVIVMVQDDHCCPNQLTLHASREYSMSYSSIQQHTVGLPGLQLSHTATRLHHLTHIVHPVLMQ